jgi:hypothetical protein
VAFTRAQRVCHLMRYSAVVERAKKAQEKPARMRTSHQRKEYLGGVGGGGGAG